MAREQISVTGILMRQRAWLAGIPLVIALIAGGISGFHLLRLQAFEAQGVEATAVIEDRRVVAHRTTRDGQTRTRRSFYVDYEYQTREGEVLTGTNQVGRGFYSDVNAGDRVTVTYMPDDPRLVELDSGRSFTKVLFFGVPALLSAAVAAFVGWRFWRRTAAMLRAGRRGERRNAKVTEHVGSKAKVGDDPMFWRLRWRDHAGVEGQSLSHDGMALERWAPRGSEIAVHVDPVTRQAFWERDIFER